MTTIEELSLSTRAYHCLKSAGVDTIKQLTAKRRYDLVRMKNLGASSLQNIEEALREVSLELTPDPEEIGAPQNVVLRKAAEDVAYYLVARAVSPKIARQIALALRAKEEAPAAWKHTYYVARMERVD